MKLPERSEKLNDGIYSTSESIIVYKCNNNMLTIMSYKTSVGIKLEQQSIRLLYVNYSSQQNF